MTTSQTSRLSASAPTPRFVAGLGCRAAAAADILAVIERAAALAGRAPTLLAAPAFKSYEPGLHEAARRLGLPLIFVADAQLRAVQPLCVTRSAAAARATGIASVAEGAALAAAGPGARLILPRIATGAATCALAESAL